MANHLKLFCMSLRIGCMLVVAALLTHAARAEKYAVLAGVNHYSGGNTLEGPVNDVVAMRNALLKQGFKAEHIKSLMDEEATRRNILDALQDYVTQVRAGDLLIFYFTGHGTSGWQKTFGEAASRIGTESGAILPYDFRFSSSPDLTARTLIVGWRDLRPILKSLNPRAKGVVILDSCYSQDAAKAIMPEGISRYVDVTAGYAKGAASNHANSPSAKAAEVPHDGEKQAAGAGDNWDVLPYDNVVSLSAASRDETARDISAKELANQTLTSVDNRPHGAFTNSLLKGFGNGAGGRHGKVSIEALFSYARADMRGTYRQTPQLSEPASRALAREITFDFGGDPHAPTDAQAGSQPNDTDTSQTPVAQVPPPPPPPPPPTLIRLSGIPDAMIVRIAGLRRVRISDQQCDLFLIYNAPNFDLYDGSGSFLRSYSRDEIDSLLDRISYDDLLRHLADQTSWKQDYDIHLEVTAPVNQGRFYAGQHLNIAASFSEPSYPVVFDIEPDGAIGFLNTAPPAAIPAGSLQSLLEGEVRPPYGTDTLAVFAFRERPEGYDRWVCHANAAGGGSCPKIVPGTKPFEEFMKFLADKKGMAEASLRVSTSSSKYTLR